MVVDKLWFFYDVLFKNRLIEISSPDLSPVNNFVSGNFFKNLSDVIIDNKRIWELEKDLTSELEVDLKSENIIYFVEMARTDPQIFNKFSERIKPASKVIFHNGDQLSIFNLERLRNRSIRIFAVNSINNENVVALPIGLENIELNTNGKVNEFLEIEALRKVNSSERDIFVCANFRLRTNYAERINILKTISEPRIVKFFWFKSPKSIHDIYKKSLFVISPPGNGFDCHRTWEAIYSGAIPIVLRSKIDQELIKNLPILALNDYSEINNYTIPDLKALYDLIWKNSNLEKIASSYWAKVINEQ
jgi:hypothetical protein